jgi:hypothetical protein
MIRDSKFDFKFEYTTNENYSFETFGFNNGCFICFNLYDKSALKIAGITWLFDSTEDLNDFMVRFVKENFERGYNQAWEAIHTHCIGEQYLIRAVEYADVEFLALNRTDCFPKLKEALTKHYCPELLQDHTTDAKPYAFFDNSKHVVDANELIINGVKYRRVE